jgi:DNA primase
MRRAHVAEFVSFDHIKQAVSIVDVLRRYGFFDALQQKGEQLVGLCPFHREGRASFKVTPVRNIWNCFGCKRGGDVIDLVCAAEGMAGQRNSSRRRAALLLQEWFSITPAAPAQEKRTTEGRTSRHQKEKDRAVDEQRNRDEAEQQDSAEVVSPLPEVINPPLGFVLKNVDYEQAYQYAEGRGIGRATAEQFGLAVALSGGYKGRLVIPLIDWQAGQEVLVGYAARALDDSEPKYLFPSREKGFHKSHLVYYLARVRGQRAAVIVEGCFDAMKVTQAGFPVVAILGSDISSWQADTLCAHFERMVLFFDGDEAGRRGTDRALLELGRRGRYVRAVMLPDGSQPDELSTEEIKRLLRP